MATPMELVPMRGMARRAEFEPAHRFRPVRYLFDITLRTDDAGRPVFGTGDAPADADMLVALVHRSGAENCDVRILAADGAAHVDLFTELADRLCCDVYCTPVGADILTGAPEAGLGRRDEAVAVDRASGRPVRWLLIRPLDVGPDLPAWFARTDGAVRSRTSIALVPLPGGVAFATRSTFTHLCGLAGWFDEDTAGVSTVIVGNRDGAFEIGRYDGSVRLVDGAHLAELVSAALPVVEGDVHLAITWPTSAEHRAGVEAQLERFAAALDRVVWAPDPADETGETWQAHSPRRPAAPAGVPLPKTSTIDNRAAIPHAIRWLSPVPPVNPEPVELFAWTPSMVSEVLHGGLPTAEPFLLLHLDPERLAVRERSGHLLRLAVPAESVVDLYEIDGPLPATLQHRAREAVDTFLLPVAWIGGVTVTAGYDLDGAGGFAAAHRVDERQLTVVFDGADHGVAGLPNTVVRWPQRHRFGGAHAYLALPDRSAAPELEPVLGWLAAWRHRRDADEHKGRLVQVAVPHRRAIDVPATVADLAHLPVPPEHWRRFAGLDLVIPAAEFANTIIEKVYSSSDDHLVGATIADALR